MKKTEYEIWEEEYQELIDKTVSLLYIIPTLK